MRRWIRSHGCCQARSVATASLPDPGSDEPERDAGGNDRDREANQRKPEPRDVRHAGKVGRRAVKCKALLFQDVVPVIEEPVRRDNVLRLAQRQRPGAHFLVELILDCVLRLGADEVWRKRAS